MRILDRDEYIRKRFKVTSYAKLQKYVKKHCLLDYFEVIPLMYYPRYRSFKAWAGLLYSLKSVAAAQGVKLPELPKLRESVWSLDWNAAENLRKQTRSKHGLFSTLLYLNLK